MDQLLANGATEVMPFEEFPTYDGFVVKDPEDRWIEVMQYTDDTFRVQEFTHAPSGECGLEMVGNAEVCTDVDAMVDWYTEMLDLQLLREYRDNEDVVCYLADRDYDPDSRANILILQNARTEEQKERYKARGNYISEIIYQAGNVTPGLGGCVVGRNDGIVSARARPADRPADRLDARALRQ